MNGINFSSKDLEIFIEVKFNSQAKRLTLRFSPQKNHFVLTAPPRTSERSCQHFIAQSRPWIEKMIPRMGKQICIKDGEVISVYDETFRCVGDSLRRKPVLCRETYTLRLPLRYSPKALHACFKKEAQECLIPYLTLIVKELGQSLEAVNFRDMRSRWGSCSAHRTISLNWRLILAPRKVAEYVCIHEAAHLLHMNHSLTFWKVVERLCPTYKMHKEWLKTKGYTLMGV